MKEINSYPKIYNFGHRAIRDIFNEPVVLQEKVDGSQISFMKKDGVVYARSKGTMLHFDNPEKMFSLGLDSIASVADILVDGHVYRGEYLQKPKHNVLKYSRVPEGHIILFDIQNGVGTEEYLPPSHIEEAANYLGFECVPTWEAKIDSLDQLSEYLLRTSCLGGASVEGVVAKNYNRFDQHTGKVLMAKHVSEAFKEVHRKKSYKTSNKDIIVSLVEHYKTEARWQKAIQHLRDDGRLLDSPRDIGSLIKEVNLDVLAECKEEIAEALFKWGWKQISRGITAGLPEWYKEKLLEKQFGGEDD